jgi:hypothetical protein
MKVLVDKIASSTKNVALSSVVEVSRNVIAMEGSVVVVKALGENPNYGSIELASGRMSRIIEGDIIAGTLGERRALRGFYGKIPKRVQAGDILNVLNLGGVIGKAVSGITELGKSIDVQVLGQALVFPTFDERIGKPATIKENAIAWKKRLGRSAPLIVFSASNMDSGKTTAACELIKGLTLKGYRVAAAKLTGISLMRDTLNMRDYGAVRALNFNDAGIVSTTTARGSDYARGIIHELNRDSPDCIVVELGDGILGGYGVKAILRDRQLMKFAKAHVFCANDQVVAWAGRELFRKFGLEISVISGKVTDNDVGTEYVGRELKLPTANALNDSKKLTSIVEQKVFGAR